MTRTTGWSSAPSCETRRSTRVAPSKSGVGVSVAIRPDHVDGAQLLDDGEPEPLRVALAVDGDPGDVAGEARSLDPRPKQDGLPAAGGGREQRHATPSGRGEQREQRGSRHDASSTNGDRLLRSAHPPSLHAGGTPGNGSEGTGVAGPPHGRRRPRPTRAPISSGTTSVPCRGPRTARPNGPAAARAAAPTRSGSGRAIGRSGTASRRR